MSNTMQLTVFIVSTITAALMALGSAAPATPTPGPGGMKCRCFMCLCDLDPKPRPPMPPHHPPPLPVRHPPPPPFKFPWEGTTYVPPRPPAVQIVNAPGQLYPLDSAFDPSAGRRRARASALLAASVFLVWCATVNY